ncbi:hypothetical protein M0R45_020174 [Rubus argutus]|uniref:Uncharacterized protein n=1 Tax=Rubus argutus TaxID=59490 RepID=A0AAW1XB41_RUBAR
MFSRLLLVGLDYDDDVMGNDELSSNENEDMAQGRGKRIRKVQKVPPPQQEATTTLSDNVPTTTSMYENVPATKSHYPHQSSPLPQFRPAINSTITTIPTSPCSFRRRTHPVPPLKDAAPNLPSLPKPSARAFATTVPNSVPAVQPVAFLPPHLLASLRRRDHQFATNPARALCFLAAVAVPSPLPLCRCVVMLPRSGLPHRCTSQPTQFTPLLQSPIQSAVPVRNHPSPPHNPAESSLS